MDPVAYPWLTANAQWKPVSVILQAADVSMRFFVNTTGVDYRVREVAANFRVTSTSGTLDIERTTSTTAPGSGTTQLTGTMSLSGTANTTVNGAVKEEPDVLRNGDSLSAKLAGTLTGLADCCVTVMLEPVPVGI